MPFYSYYLVSLRLLRIVGIDDSWILSVIIYYALFRVRGGGDLSDWHKQEGNNMVVIFDDRKLKS